GSPALPARSAPRSICIRAPLAVCSKPTSKHCRTASPTIRRRPGHDEDPTVHRRRRIGADRGQVGVLARPSAAPSPGALPAYPVTAAAAPGQGSCHGGRVVVAVGPVGSLAPRLPYPSVDEPSPARVWAGCELLDPGGPRSLPALVTYAAG